MSARFAMGVGRVHEWLLRDGMGFLMKDFRQSGVDFVEMPLDAQTWRRDEPRALLALDDGLDCTFHVGSDGPYNVAGFDSAPNNPTQQAYTSIFAAAAGIGARKGTPARITLHGASGPRYEAKPKLLDRTAAFLKWAHAVRSDHGWPVEFVLELLPHDPLHQTAGDTVEDLMALLTKSGPGVFQLCWDLGHYHLNQERGYDGPITPEFLKQVSHINLHDLKDGVDHAPLATGEVPYEGYLRQASGGPALQVVLELNFQQAAAAGAPFTVLFAGIDEMRRLRDQPSGRSARRS